ncbi:MAG TPA: DUF3754 domain-containing protein [Crenotrichaceae bacterium]|nr:DUF3754 domain-containing protein [Crenotrichaceae bacterium]
MNTIGQTTQQFVQNNTLEHFIPIALEELVPQLLDFTSWSSEFEQEQFADICHRLIALYHAQFHAHFRFLKRCYQPFNPDQDTSTARSKESFDSSAASKRFVGLMRFVLEKANYVPLSHKELNQAMKKTSPYGVEVTVNFDDFEEIELFYRGRATRVTYQRHWKQLWLSKTRIETPVYRRMLLILKPKVIDDLDQSAKKTLWESDSLTIGGKKQGAIFIKLFKDIPHSDLEMLFPNIHIRMRLFDKLKIGITGSGGTIGGISATMSKIAATADPIAIGMAIFGFAGLIWRQVVKVFTQRTKYMAKLAQSLYYYNLDNNSGAISYLISLAEAEECKETLLTYYVLSTQGACTRNEIDKRVENYLANHNAPGTDFEIQDGVAKLEQLGVLKQDNQGIYSVVDLEPTLDTITSHWNNLFENKDDDTLFVNTFNSKSRSTKEKAV